MCRYFFSLLSAGMFLSFHAGGEAETPAPEKKALNNFNFKNVRLHDGFLFSFAKNIRVAVETFGMDGAGMIGDAIIHRDHPLWGTTAFWYGLPVQDAGSTPELIERE